MNRFQTVLVALVAFVILGAITVGAAMLFVPGPYTIAFYAVVGQIVVGEVIVFLLLARSIIASGRRGGASGATQLGTYNLFFIAYYVSLVLTVGYFGFNVEREGTANDYIFAGIQLLVLGLPLVFIMMSETTMRFVEEDGRDAQDEADRAKRRVAKAFRDLDETIADIPPAERDGAAMQQLDMAMRTLRASIDSKLGLRNRDSRDLADEIEDLESRFKASLRSGAGARPAIADLAAQVSRATQRL